MKYFYLLFLVSSAAHAGVYLEPAIGYEYGKITESYVKAGTATLNYATSGGGLNAGAKLGYRATIFFLGAEYEKSKMSNAEPVDISGYAGIVVPLIKVWVSYIFKAKTDTGEGSGYKLGVGTSLFMFASLNAEYSARTYNAARSGRDANGATYSGDLNTVKVTVSLPLGF